MSVAEIKVRAHDGDFMAEKFAPHSFQKSESDGFHHCSYCGSIATDDAITLLTMPGVGFSGSDWKYGWPHKFYFDAPNQIDGLQVIGALYNGGKTEPGPEYEAKGYVRMDQLTEEQRRIAIRDGCLKDTPGRRADDHLDQNWIQFGIKSLVHLKFYSAHLKDDGDPALVSAFSGHSKSCFGVDFVLDEGGLKWWAPRGIQRYGVIGPDGRPIHEDRLG